MLKKDKYWAKKVYQRIDPAEYEEKRFSGPAGEIIDEIEKSSVLELLSGHSPLNILDAACGTGRLTIFLKEKLNGKVRITGLDISPKMLNLAKEKTKALKGINFIEGDIYNLPFFDNKFDAVVGLRFSMHLPEIEIALKEVSRVVKKGGLVVFDTWNFDSLLRLKEDDRLPEERGVYKIKEIIKKAQEVNLKLEGKKGILLLGETVLRKCPAKLLPLLYFSLNPVPPFSNLATKLTLSFKKTK